MDDLSIENNLYERRNDIAETFVWKQHENLGYQSHFHAAMELCFVLQGSMETTVNGNKQVLYAGDIALANPFEIHHYGESDAYVAVFIVSNNFLADYKAEYGDKLLHSFLTDKEYNKQILNLFSDIPPSFNNNTSLNALAKKGYVNLVLAKIISRYGFTTQTTSQAQIMQIMNYIYKNFDQKLTLKTLADEFNYTQTSISRLLSKALKTDLRSFISRLRAEQAHVLLSNEKYADYSVIQIAELCGFDSAATFYRAYKKRYNRLPRQ